MHTPPCCRRSLPTFAERNVGRIRSAEDCSRPRANFQVWRTTAGNRERTWYLKQDPGAKFHAREVHAYVHRTTALGQGRLPGRHAANPVKAGGPVPVAGTGPPGAGTGRVS